MANKKQDVIIGINKGVTEAISVALIEKGKVKITNLGILEVKTLKPRNARNPLTGKVELRKKHKRVTFRPTNSLKEALKK